MIRLHRLVGIADPDFSVICVYNDREMLEQMLLSGLENQSSDRYETVLINNQEQDYHSAAEALNTGAEQAVGDYYFFVHQDVKLLGNKWFETAKYQLELVDDLGVAGFAGMASSGFDPKKKGRNTILHGDDKRDWRLGNKIEEPHPVQTVDELGLVVPSHVFVDYRFNPTICDGWHLYAVEYCLRIKSRTDLDVYALPMDLWHNSLKNTSSGTVQDISYYKTLVSIVEAYPELETIYTTCGFWPVNIQYIQMVFYSLILLDTVLPHSLSKRAMSLWPSIWGGAVPLLWREGTDGVPVLLSEIRRQI